jgi:hypothetical protein
MEARATARSGSEPDRRRQCLSDQGYDFIHWRPLRRAPNCHAPVILITGSPPSQSSAAKRRRQLVVRKAVAPLVMMKRILWLLNDQRQFVTSPNYCGLTRVKSIGLPVGTGRPPHDDLRRSRRRH